MPRGPTPCQPFVLLARSAPVGVVLRRGPTRWTQVVRWNTQTDVFESGQWFQGRLYERRCDLSPSGDKLIYFVAKHHLQNVDESYTRTWTAVSRPPYLTALALWPNGGTTHHGGGLFETEHEVRLNSFAQRPSNPDHAQVPAPHPRHVPPKRVHVSPIAFTAGDQLFAKRLVRDGWTLVTPGDVDCNAIEGGPRLFVRALRLRRLELELGYQVMTYALFEKTGRTWTEVAFTGVTWADFDKSGRLVFARDGKLFALQNAGGLDDAQLPVDLNDRKPARVMPSESAKKW